MIFCKESAVQQIDHLLHIYDGLSIENILDTEIVLGGHILVNRTALGYQLYKKYQIRIIIPLNSDSLPYVIDIGNQIEKGYQHRYADGQLCLETDAAIRTYFIAGFNLEIWMRDFVEPYYFSYEYYQRYGVFPFGERAHGIEGVLQTYGEYFNEVDYVKIFRLMECIQFGQYRGHLPCPCGSGKKMRSCHGKFIKKFFENNNLKVIVQSDYKTIREVLDAYYEQSRNSNATK